MEVFLERTDHIGVLAEQDKITSVSPAFGMGAGIRVFLGGRDGFVSTNDLSDAGLHLALDQALAMLSLNATTLTASLTAFDGLEALTELWSEIEHQWLGQSPDLATITALLLQGTVLAKAMASTSMCDVAAFPGIGRRFWSLPSDGTFARDIRLHQSTGLSVLAADGEHRSSIRAATAVPIAPMICAIGTSMLLQKKFVKVLQPCFEPITSMEARCQLSWPTASAV